MRWVNRARTGAASVMGALLAAAVAASLTAGFAQKSTGRTKHLRVELALDRSTNDQLVRLSIEPRGGWRIIAVEDTLSGKPLRVAWEGAIHLTNPVPGVPYVVAEDTTRVYDRLVEMTARVTSRPVIVRINYLACRKVCETGWVSVRH